MSNTIPLFSLLQSDEDEDNFDEVRRAIEDSIRQRLMRLNLFYGQGVLGEIGSSQQREPGIVAAASSAQEISQCRREECVRQRAVDRLTGQWLDFCNECSRQEERPQVQRTAEGEHTLSFSYTPCRNERSFSKYDSVLRFVF